MEIFFEKKILCVKQNMPVFEAFICLKVLKVYLCVTDLFYKLIFGKFSGISS